MYENDSLLLEDNKVANSSIFTNYVSSINRKNFDQINKVRFSDQLGQGFRNSFRYGRIRIGIEDIADEANLFYTSKRNVLYKS